MNRELIGILIIKELRQILRNRRVIIGLLLPLILYPALFGIYSSVVSNAEQSAETEISNIVVTSAVPEMLMDMLNEDSRLSVTHESGDLSSKIREKTYDVAIEYTLQKEQHQFKFYYDSGRSSGRKAYDRIMDSVDIFEEASQYSFLEERSKDISLLNPFLIEEEDVANQAERSGKSLGDIIPMILTISALLSVVNFAIEMTTGEKEAGTLETLFSVPVTRSELVTSKLITCILLGLLSMVISLIAMMIILPSIIQQGDLSFRMTFETIGILILTLIPLILMGAGASLGIGMFANSYKESGAYITPLTFLFMIPAYVGLIPGVELNEMLASIPIVNSTLLIKSVFLNTFNMTYFSIGFVSNMIVSILSLIFMFKVFGAEKILFGSGKSFSLRLNRKEIKKKKYIEPQDAVLLVVIAVILFIYAGGVASNILGIVNGTIFIQVMAFASIPLFLTWYMKADIKATIGMKVPKVIPSIGGFFLWVGALSFMLVYQVLIAEYVPEVPTMAGIEEVFNDLSVTMQFIFIALTPGICEEILFRGLALKPIEDKLGAKRAVLITALLFSLMHLDIVRLIPTFLLGCVLGLVTLASGSILPAMGLHILNNAFAAFGLQYFELSVVALLIIGCIAFSIGLIILFKKPFDRPLKEDYNVDNK